MIKVSMAQSNRYQMNIHTYVIHAYMVVTILAEDMNSNRNQRKHYEQLWALAIICIYHAANWENILVRINMVENMFSCFLLYA
jgi:hypothetical protein